MQQALNGQACGNLWLTVCCRVGNFVVGFVGLFLRGSHLQLVSPHQIGQFPSPIDDPWIYVGGFIRCCSLWLLPGRAQLGRACSLRCCRSLGRWVAHLILDIVVRDPNEPVNLLLVPWSRSLAVRLHLPRRPNKGSPRGDSQRPDPLARVGKRPGYLPM